MTQVSLRMPEKVVRELDAAAKLQDLPRSELLRRFITDGLQKKTGNKARFAAAAEEIHRRAGRWDGTLSGEETLRRTRGWS